MKHKLKHEKTRGCDYRISQTNPKTKIRQIQNSHAAKNKGMHWDGFVLTEEGEVSVCLPPQVER